MALLGGAACSSPHDSGRYLGPHPDATSTQEAAAAGATGPPASARAGPTPTLTPYGDAAFPAYAVTATAKVVGVFDNPSGTQVRTLANPQPSGAPLTFLLLDRSGDWLRVELPVRPNQSTGWVRAEQVSVAGVPYRLDVLLHEHELRLYDRNRLEQTYPIGVGTAETPTPGGLYYLKELLEPRDPNGAYGPYAYGLSGFSNVLHDYANGDGVIGLHGTNDPAGVGKDVSHGCIRLRNADITALVKVLPLGTPVRILA